MLNESICKLSIILPVHNVEKYIEKCMDSLLRAACEQMEILCIDDGSTDGSGRLCEKFALRDRRVKVLHQENRGLPAVRNVGLSIAKGEYISFVDSDDWIDGGLLESFIEFMDNEPEVDICVGGAVREYPDGSEAPLFEMSSPQMFTREEALREMVTGRIFFWYLWGKVYRRSVFEGFSADETVTTGEDLDSLWQIFQSGKVRKVWYSPEYKYHYYYNPCGMTEGKKRMERYQSDLYVFEKILRNTEGEKAEVLDLIRDRAVRSIYSILRECFFSGEQLERIGCYIGKGIGFMEDMSADVKQENIITQRVEQMAGDEGYARDFFGAAFSSMRKAVSEAGSFPKRYIYGTGIVSQYVTDMLEEEGGFDGFVISDGRPGALTFAGRPVYHLSELSREEEKSMILAVNRKNQREIRKALHADRNTKVLIPDIPEDF